MPKKYHLKFNIKVSQLLITKYLSIPTWGSQISPQVHWILLPLAQHLALKIHFVAHFQFFFWQHWHKFDNALLPVRSTCPKETIFRAVWFPTCEKPVLPFHHHVFASISHISLRFVSDMSQICLRFVSDLSQICLRFVDHLKCKKSLRSHLMQQLVCEVFPNCDFSDHRKPSWVLMKRKKQGSVKWAT